MNSEQLKFLMRLQATIAGLLEAARRADGNYEKGAVGERLVAVVDQASGHLGEELNQELQLIVGSRGEGGSLAAKEVAVCASAIDGWLKGVIHGETYESRLRAEAEALAQARIAAERPVGFGQ